MIITEDQMAQKRRINRASTAVYQLMYELDTEDGQPSDNEWMFVFGEVLHNMIARRLKYARMARKRWEKEAE